MENIFLLYYLTISYEFDSWYLEVIQSSYVDKLLWWEALLAPPDSSYAELIIQELNIFGEHVPSGISPLLWSILCVLDGPQQVVDVSAIFEWVDAHIVTELRLKVSSENFLNLSPLRLRDSLKVLDYTHLVQ